MCLHGFLGERVLGEVVRPDGKEIRLASELCRQDGVEGTSTMIPTGDALRQINSLTGRARHSAGATAAMRGGTTMPELG